MSWKWKAPNGVDYLVTDRWSLLDKHDLANMLAEVRALDGRLPIDVFGEDVPLGEISFTDWSPDTCGCVHRYLARKDGVGKPSAHRVIHHCDVHKHYKGNHAAHYAAILKENRHKNATVNELAEQHGIADEKGNPAPHHIEFSYDEKRQLVVSHPVFGKKVMPQSQAN